MKVSLTHLDKIFWPKEGYTKGDLIEYYQKIAPILLPYLLNHPLVMERFPDGITKQSFYQKDYDGEKPNFLKTTNILSQSTKEKVDYLVCKNLETLLFTINLGCIEVNPWHSKIGSLDNPEYLIFDLDPVEVSFAKVVETALKIRQSLQDLNIKGYCKTSGSRGLHIFVPLAGKYRFDKVREFAQKLAESVHQELDSTSLERDPAKRRGKVYIDYLRNSYGQTIVSPYSVRPKPGAPVSTPLKWEEVKANLNPAEFNIKSLFKRLEKVGDLWKPLLGKGVDLEKNFQ